MRRLTLAALAALFPFVTSDSHAQLPRTIAPVDPPRALGADMQPAPLGWRIVAKFDDALAARAENGDVVSRSGADLSAVRDVALAESLSFRPALDWSEARAAAFTARAQMRTGVAQPDLLTIVIVEAPSAVPAELERIARVLLAVGTFEYVEIETLGTPPPGDIAPPTPDLAWLQSYTLPNVGFAANAAWSRGIFGQGVRLADCEYGWVLTHEDLVDAGVVPEPGQTPSPHVVTNGWDEHGTAALGSTAAPWNGYGVSGLAPQAAFAVFPEHTIQQGSRRLQAVTNAIESSVPGDVVLLEMQTTGAGGGYGPAELSNSIRLVCTVGTAAGITIVGAAGNGNQDLDSLPYAPYKAAPHSGAILVGAGSADASHSKLGFSTFGSRVDVQAWGGSVMTLGYGSFAAYGGDKNQRYTNTFAGTSSASGLVAGACVLVQSFAKERLGAPLDPRDLRDLLVSTGIPQGQGGHIGPHPNLAAAFGVIDGWANATTWATLAGGLPGAAGTPLLAGSGVLSGSGPKLTLTSSAAAPSAPLFLVVGTSLLDLPLFGGTLVPYPDLVLPVGSTTALGTHTFVAPSGGAVPPGMSIWFQSWIVDAAASEGFAASNGVRATANP